MAGCCPLVSKHWENIEDRLDPQDPATVPPVPKELGVAFNRIRDFTQPSLRNQLDGNPTIKHGQHTPPDRRGHGPTS